MRTGNTITSRILNYEVSYLSLDTEEINYYQVDSSLKELLFLESIAPPTSYFLYLYRTVGKKYEWTDWLAAEKSVLEKFLSNEAVILYSLVFDGAPRGFFVLDFREPFVCDLAYFGLFDEMIGKGFGKLMMNRAFKIIVDRGEIRNITVNTNTLDHSNALPFYKKSGFNVLKVEQHSREAWGSSEFFEGEKNV